MVVRYQSLGHFCSLPAADAETARFAHSSTSLTARDPNVVPSANHAVSGPNWSAVRPV